MPWSETVQAWRHPQAAQHPASMSSACSSTNWLPSINPSVTQLSGATPPVQEASQQLSQQMFSQQGYSHQEYSHRPGQELVPGTRVVSTSHLEIMGWDLFADTLGTFHLLSDAPSEPTSQALPEPSDFGPVTPAVAAHQTKYTPVAALTPFAHVEQHVGWHSQDLADFEVPFMEDCLSDTDPQMVDPGVRKCEAGYGNAFHKHFNRHVYETLESPREVHYQGQHASDRVVDTQLRHSARSCGCFGSAKQQNAKEGKPVTWWRAVIAKGRACIHPSYTQEV